MLLVAVRRARPATQHRHKARGKTVAVLKGPSGIHCRDLVASLVHVVCHIQ